MAASSEGMSIKIQEQETSSRAFLIFEDRRETFETDGTSLLFGISNKSEITSDDKGKMHTLVDYYVGGVDNINEEHQQGIVEMFNDATFQYCTYQAIKYL